MHPVFMRTCKNCRCVGQPSATQNLENAFCSPETCVERSAACFLPKGNAGQVSPATIHGKCCRWPLRGVDRWGNLAPPVLF